ncbi:MAG: hypothetical protein JJT95_16430 [Pararhodobacter sp.]|nr:hypothetical protein [Pararhodobacter sp.]
MAQGNRKSDNLPDDQEPVSLELERQINENLQKLYQQTLDEQLPDHLQELLQRLKKQDQEENRVK